MLAMDEVLQRKLQYVEQQLEQMALGQASIQTLPERKYIPLGEEATLYQNEIFYFYPTIAFVQDAPSGQPPDFLRRLSGAIPVRPGALSGTGRDAARHADALRPLPGHVSRCHRLWRQLRLAHPELPLSDDALHFNIVDQFIETEQENYITEIQIPILDA